MSRPDTHAALGALPALSRQAWHAAPARPAGAEPVAERIFRALSVPGQRDLAPPPCALPACTHLPAALAAARAGAPAVSALAAAFEALVPSLAWYRRPGAEPDGGGFFDGHANAHIAGPRGLERRSDVMVGVSLVAPGVRYPDHHHPPEEIYLVLSPGQWRQGDGPWHTPGPGGVVHNPPGVVHAMRAGAAPLLALWYLWLGSPA